MEGDDRDALDRDPGKLGVSREDVAIRAAVESEAADAVGERQLPRDRVPVRGLGQGRVERRVEHGDHRHRLAERVSTGANRRQAGRIVQRGQALELLDGVQHLVVDQDRLSKTLAAVHDAMTDGVDRRQLQGPNPGERPRERGGVIGSLDLVRERRVALSLKRRAWGGADALDRAARERPRRRTIARVEHAKFERRAAGIHDEHCHGTDPGMRGLLDQHASKRVWRRGDAWRAAGRVLPAGRAAVSARGGVRRGGGVRSGRGGRRRATLETGTL